MYQTVLNRVAAVADLYRWLDADTLHQLWPSLWLPPGYVRFGMRDSLN